MIVVDTNVIAYLWLPGEFSETVEAVLKQDAAWAAPLLWRSEFRNILAGYLRRKQLTLETATRALESAEQMLAGREYHVPSDRVMSFVAKSLCSAYDCEFVALADDLSVPLVTADAQILREFPNIAVHLRDFVKRRT